MSTEYKNIVVALAAKLGKSFTPTFKRGSKSVDQFGGRVGKAAKGIGAAGRLIKGALVAAAVGGVAIYTKRVIASMDATGKLSDRLGLTTESLIGLRHAGELAGLGTGEMDKALEKLTRNLGEARQGAGPAADAIAQLGLTTEDLSAMSADQQMGAIADAMTGITSTADRAAIATDLFGKAGQKLGTLLGQGSSGIKTAMAEADALGLTYNRGTAAMAERVSDAMSRIKAAFTGVGTQLIGTVLPWIARGAEWLASSISGIWSAIKTVFGYIVDIAFWLAEHWIKTFTLLEAACVNWRSTLEIILKGAALGIVTFVNDVAYFFTDKLPVYLEWFGRNWKNIFTDLYNVTTTIFSNMWKNISGFFKAVWSWIKGEGFDFEWTGLLDGFKATTEKLPQIAARAQTALEKQLAADVGAAAGKIARYYTDKVGERMKVLESYRKSFEGGGGGSLENSVFAKKKTAALGEAGGEAAAGSAASEQAKSFGILGRGMSIAALAAAGGAVDQQKAIANHTASTAEDIKALRKAAMGGGQFLIFGGD